MNYKKVYDNIIESAKENALVRKEEKINCGVYFENHHIIPKFLGGRDDETNMVLLTAREHYICHWILYKINPCKENAFSWWMMSNNPGNKYHTDRKRQTSRSYEYAKKAFSLHIGDVHRGKPLSQEHKNKLSQSKKGDKNYMYGKKHTEERKKHLSEINKGEKNKFYGKTHTPEVRKRISDSRKNIRGEKHPNFGRRDMFSDETKKKFSDLYSGKPRAKPHEIVECPHCEKTGIKPNMKRWHFDNCKHKD
jgi:hypothetical protein